MGESAYPWWFMLVNDRGVGKTCLLDKNVTVRLLCRMY